MRRFKEYFLITCGIVLLAIAIEFFLAPNKIAAGGVSGIAIIVNYYIPSLSVGILILIMNIVLFVMGFIVIGNKFGAKTIYSSLSLSGIMWVMEQFITPEMIPTKDLMLSAVFGTLITGVGMGMVFNQNASTGGTDILAKILNKFLHIDIGKSLLAVDFTVTIFSAFAFGAEVGMYALLAVILNGFVIDYVIDGFNLCKQIYIISPKNNEISKFIIEVLERGCTVFNGKGAYTGDKSDILYCVLGRGEFVRLRKFMRDIDKDAFIIVSDAHEVLGEGFKNLIDD